MLMPGYHYATFPGGIRRSKISCKAGNVDIKQHQQQSVSGMYHRHHERDPQGNSYLLRNSYRPPSTTSENSHVYEDSIGHCPSRSHSHGNCYQSPARIHWRSRGEDYLKHAEPQDITDPVHSMNVTEHVIDEGSKYETPERAYTTERDRDRQYWSSLPHHDSKSSLQALENMTIADGVGNCRCCSRKQIHNNPAARDIHDDHVKSLTDYPRLEMSGIGLISFPTAAAKLNEVTKNAIDFFGSFEATFQTEVHHLSAYCTQRTIKSAWQDKILRNEKYQGKPKEGWARQSIHQHDSRTNKEPHRQNDNWSRHNKNDADQNDTETVNDDHFNEPLTAFSEHLSLLRRSINVLLNSQILKPKLRHYSKNSTSDKWHDHDHGFYSDGDDYIDPEDVQSMMEYNSSHQLLKRVHHCKTDLLPLLDRIWDDNIYMKRLLIELRHLAGVVDSYNDR